MADLKISELAAADPLDGSELVPAVQAGGNVQTTTQDIADLGGSGSVASVVAGNNIDVDATDPANPIVAVETLTLADVSDITSTATEVNYTDGVTSAIQTQLNTKTTLAAVDAQKLSVFAATSSAELAGVISDETGTNKLVYSDSPTLVTPALGTPTALVGTNISGTAAGLTAGAVTVPAALASSTATTQTPADNSTKVATTAYVDNAVLGQNFKEAVKVATTANLVGLYANGASGVGATFTYTATGTDVIDGVTLALGDRVLVKNQSTDFQNGIYTVTTAGALAVAGILTRATDADQTTDYKTGDSLFVTAGTAQTSTTWAYTGIDNPTMGTTSLTYVQTAGQGSFSAGNGIAITGTSIAIDTGVTVDKTTGQTLTNKTLTSPVVNTGISGTAIDTDGTLAANSDTLLASQKAVKTYADTKAPKASPTFTGTVTLPVGLTGVIRTDTGVVSVDTDVTDIVTAASATAQGKVELATDAETVTGTDTARATTPANITAKMAAPGAIGGTTAAAITGTVVTANTSVLPDADDGAVLGAAGTAFSDLFLAEGGVINWDSGDATITQTGDVVAVAGADLRVATAGVGTNADSVPTLSSTNTLTNKTLTTPTISATGFANANHAHAGSTSGGTITYSDIITRPKVFFSDIGASIVSNTTSPTSMFSTAFSFAANDLAIGYVIELDSSFIWSNNTGANQTLTVQVQVNGNNYATYTTAAIATSISSHHVAVSGRWRINTNTAIGGYVRIEIGGAGISSIGIADNTATTSTVLGNVTSTTNTVDVIATMSTSTATCSLTGRGSVIKVFPNV